MQQNVTNILAYYTLYKSFVFHKVATISLTTVTTPYLKYLKQNPLKFLTPSPRSNYIKPGAREKAVMGL